MTSHLQQTIAAIMADGRPRTVNDIAGRLTDAKVKFDNDRLPNQMGYLVSAGELVSFKLGDITAWELNTGQKPVSNKRNRRAIEWDSDADARACALDAVERVAREHQLAVASLLGQSTRARIAEARREAMHAARQDGVPTRIIADLFKRDRRTVNHAVQRIREIEDALQEAAE